MILVAEGRERLDRFLARQLPEHTRTKLARFIEAGGVRVSGEVRTKAGFEVRPGDEIEVGEVPERPPHDLTPADIPLVVPYEDANVLVVDKPRGLATHPAPSLDEPTLVNALLGRGQALSAGSEPYRPGIVHRLDKETTGLLIVAKDDAAHAHLATQIQNKTAERRYLAIVSGKPELDRFKIEAPIARDPRNPVRMAVIPEGKPALTHVRSVGPAGDGHLLALKLETGRTHQIRVHLASIGLPVRGDALYATGKWSQGPMALHAAAVAFDHPKDGRRISIFSQPPAEFGVDVGPEAIEEGA